MKGIGPRDERETIVRFDESSDNADVWTASESLYRRLRKRGWEPIEDNERSASFIIPKKFVSIRSNTVRAPRKLAGIALKKSRHAPNPL